MILMLLLVGLAFMSAEVAQTAAGLTPTLFMLAALAGVISALRRKR